jgi:hypothetical protein
MSIAWAMRMTDTIPGFCPPRSMLLMYERSIALRWASSSWETPCATRHRRMAAPSATSTGSFACRGDEIGMRRCSAYDANRTTDDLPHALLPPADSVAASPATNRLHRRDALADRRVLSLMNPESCTEGGDFRPCRADVHHGLAALISTPRGSPPHRAVGALRSDEGNFMYSSNAPRCPLCPGHGVLLGRLGQFRWYRCRDCGWDFNRPARSRAAPGPSPQREGVRLG